MLWGLRPTLGTFDENFLWFYAAWVGYGDYAGGRCDGGGDSGGDGPTQRDGDWDGSGNAYRNFLRREGLARATARCSGPCIFCRNTPCWLGPRFAPVPPEGYRQLIPSPYDTQYGLYFVLRNFEHFL